MIEYVWQNVLDGLKDEYVPTMWYTGLDSWGIYLFGSPHYG
jgi:hypothetical protein